MVPVGADRNVSAHFRLELTYTLFAIYDQCYNYTIPRMLCDKRHSFYAEFVCKCNCGPAM